MLYEMAAGKKAFDEPESVQRLLAIISKDRHRSRSGCRRRSAG
jgi:hypothetical protein